MTPSETLESESDPPLPPPRRKGCGCWTVLLVCLVTPPLFAAIGYGLWRWTASARLAGRIAAVEERGEPTTIEELEARYPPTPETELATELWRSAADAATPKDPNLAQDLERFYTDLDGKFPSYDMRELGATVIFDEEGLLDETYRPVAERYRGEIAFAVEKAEEAERAGGATRFLIEGERLHDTVEHWRRFFALYQALRLEIELRRVQGDAEGVARGIGTILATGEALKNEPDPHAQSARWRAIYESLRPLKASLVRNDLSDESLEKLQRAYEDISFDAAIRPVLLTYQLVEIRRSQNLEPLNEHFRKIRFCPEEVTALTLGFLREMLDVADDPEAVIAAQRAVEDRMIEEQWGPDSNFATHWITGIRYAEATERLLAPRMSAHGMENVELYASLAATAIACVRYRRAEGELPATLDELVPEYLSEIPIDSDAEPAASIRYLVTETGFVVYGVGYNRTDDQAERVDYIERDDVLRIEKAEFAPPPAYGEAYLPPLSEEEVPIEEMSSDEGLSAETLEEEPASESSEDAEGASEQP